MKSCFADSYFEKFQNIDAVKKAVDDAEAATVWQAGVTSKDIKIIPIEGPIEVPTIVRRTGLRDEVVYDTADQGSKLLLKYGNKEFPLRLSAMRSLFDTAKISGAALGRLSPYKLAEVLNHCLSVAKGSTLLLHRFEKCSAVLSDNAGGYRIMPMSELLGITTATVSRDFGAPTFLDGWMDHDILSVTWTLPEKQNMIMDSYQKLIQTSGSGMYGCRFMPAVRFVTSDTGASSATLIPYFVGERGAEFALCDPIKVDHKRLGAMDGVDLFERKAQDIFPTFLSAGVKLEELSKIRIQYAQNAFIGICKKIELSKKYAAPALEMLNDFTNDGAMPCTAYDLYICMSEAVGVAKRMGCSASIAGKVFESVSKVLRLNFEEFDIPGIIAWGNK